MNETATESTSRIETSSAQSGFLITKACERERLLCTMQETRGSNNWTERKSLEFGR